MKIAIYLPFWPAGKNASGIVTYASQIIPALRGLGHEIFVITTRKGDDDPHTIDLGTFTRSSSVWMRAIERLLPGSMAWRELAFAIRSCVSHLHRNYGIDAFEIEETYGLSLPISRCRVLPVIVRLHGPWFLTGAVDERARSTRASHLRQKWEGMGIDNATLVSGPSKEILRAVRSHYGKPLRNVCVVPNPLRPAQQGSTWDLGSCQRNNILFVGRFDRQKGGDLVLRVFAELLSAHPELTLTFVGPDLGINGPDKKSLLFQDFIRSNLPTASGSKIKFCGQLPHSELTPLRKASFLTIVASQYETMPYAVLEPMSLGCPIVATRVGGIPEMIDDGRNGLLVPSQDVHSMTEACRTLIDNPILAAKLGHQAWEDSRRLYDPAAVAKQTVQAYQWAIDRFKVGADERPVSPSYSDRL